MIRYLRREQTLAMPLPVVWDYFCDPRNLDAITPPDLHFTILTDDLPPMYQGQIIEYRVEFIKGIRSRWLTEIRHVVDQRYFVDEQRIGPYRLWYHEHHFAETARGVVMRDQVTYEIGLGLLGEALGRLWIERRLETIFDYRRRVIAERFNGLD